ncbi:MAG: hypothetical protein Q4C95_10940 [Planctomycetia bacterium]|nr:hypothetical protein [Planctomycetia bacterium]
MKKKFWLLFCIVFFLPSLVISAESAKFTLVGDWNVQVEFDGQTQIFEIGQPDYYCPKNEKYDSLPLFNPNGPSWRMAMPLVGTNAQECCVFDALVPGSVEVRLNPKDEVLLTEGKDYALDVRSGNIGRLDGGNISDQTPVYITYQSVMMRLDSIVLNQDGSMELIAGQPHRANPVPPILKKDQKRLGNIWVNGRIEKLSDQLLFPVLSDENFSFNDDSVINDNPVAAQLLPKTWKKLQNGEQVRILAWGDSVTECGYLPDSDRWQQQFADRLQKKFPKAKIILLTEGWGGRTTGAYLNEPEGSPRNYQEKVLNLKPDLIVSEFVNDSYMDANMVNEQYGRIKNDFDNIGAEWIICTPHYIRADWMGLSKETDVDNDPRPYVTALRNFGQTNQVAVADASLFYGQLWRKGIPYSTLMVNNINHPNKLGMALFADAIMKLF